MSHRHSVIEPADGLTVLIGPNNCGKSAIVTALQILCHNDNSTYVLRHGAKECSVIVETVDGHRIQWNRKKSGSPSYVIDGEEFDRLRGESGVWNRLNETLRLPRIDCDKNQFDVHIGEQSNPVFLLNDKGKGAAQFFASSSDAIRLVEMQDLHKTRVRENKKEHARLSMQKTQVGQALKSLDPVARLTAEISACEKEHERLHLESLRIQVIENHLQVLTQHLNDVDRTSRISGALNSLVSPQNYEEVSVLGDRINDLEQTRNTIKRLAKMLEGLESLLEPPVFENESGLAGMIKDLADQDKSIATLEEQGALLAAVEAPSIEEYATAELEECIQQIEESQASCLQIGELHKNASRRVVEMENAIEQWLSENPTCPTCGSEVDKAVILSGGGHRHG